MLSMERRVNSILDGRTVDTRRPGGAAVMESRFDIDMIAFLV